MSTIRYDNKNNNNEYISVYVDSSDEAAIICLEWIVVVCRCTETCSFVESESSIEKVVETSISLYSPNIFISRYLIQQTTQEALIPMTDLHETELTVFPP